MLKRALIKSLGLPYARTLKSLRTRKFARGREFNTSGAVRCKITESETSRKSSSVETEKKVSVAEKSSHPYVIEEKDQELVDDLKKGNIFHPYKGPYERASKIFVEDLKIGGRQVISFVTNVKVGNLEHVYFPRYTDILVIGNGAMGLMVAYEIRNRFPLGPDVMVVDRNPDFPHVSTNLGQGTLMQQLFTEEEEIQMSQYCAEFLRTYHRNTEVEGHPQFKVPFEPLGGLVLADETNAEELIKRSEIMKKHGVSHKILDREKLMRKFPWLDLEGVLFGSLGMANEGLFDPWSFLLGLKYKSVNLGVKFVTAEVVDIAESNNQPTRVVCKLPDGSYNSIDFAYVVLATGMETLNLMEIVNKTDISPMKLKLPLEERKRYEYCLTKADGPGLDTPIVIDPDGTYFRREGMGGHYVVGASSIPSADDPENGIYEVFNRRIKPFLARRVPEFEKLEIVRGWMDRYDTNTANEVGIVGPHPGDPRIIFANGFTHHGLQYVPAVARAIMEYIMYSSYRTLNLRRFEVNNLYHRQHMEADERRRKFLESQDRVAISD